MAARAPAGGSYPGILSWGLSACAGPAGMLHDAGHLAVTQLAAAPDDPVLVTAAGTAHLTERWTVDLAGLLPVSAIAAVVVPGRPMRRARRWTGAIAAPFGLVAVVPPWTTGVAGPSPAPEQIGHVLHPPVMARHGAVDLRRLRHPAGAPGPRPGAG